MTHATWRTIVTTPTNQTQPDLTVPAPTVTPTGRWRRGRRLLMAGIAALALTLAACSEDADDATNVDADEAVDQADGALDDLEEQADEALDEVADEAEEALDEVDEDAVDEAMDDAEEVVEGGDTEEVANELSDALRANGLESFASAVDQIDLAALAGTDDFTLLAPNDEAFLALEGDQAADLLGDPDALTAVVENHLVAEPLDSATISGQDSVTTVGGASLAVRADDAGVMIGSATVVDPDIQAGSAVIHVIDQVLLP